VEQEIVNLAVNARDAMPRGGTLTVQTGHASLEEHDSRLRAGYSAGHYQLLSVIDTGVGMDAEVRSHLFEPFFTTKEVGKGTGLGLSTVYGIVQQSGGWISVESEPGRGSTFRIYLPRIEEPVTVKSEPKVQAAHLEGKALEGQGYRVLTAADGITALDVVTHHKGPIDLLLTDVIMPHMYGFELALQVSKLHPKTKVLYMSGYTSDPRVQGERMQRGAAFLQKPIRPESLVVKIRTLLDSRD
jgi:CheY-like chemotaxis protein